VSAVAQRIWNTSFESWQDGPPARVYRSIDSTEPILFLSRGLTSGKAAGYAEIQRARGQVVNKCSTSPTRKILSKKSAVVPIAAAWKKGQDEDDAEQQAWESAPLPSVASSSAAPFYAVLVPHRDGTGSFPF
jgi:hypothetical protein